MILTTGCWPDRSQLVQAGDNTEAAENAEQKSVKKGDGADRRQYKPNGPRNSNPRTRFLVSRCSGCSQTAISPTLG